MAAAVGGGPRGAGGGWLRPAVRPPLVKPDPTREGGKANSHRPRIPDQIPGPTTPIAHGPIHRGERGGAAPCYFPPFRVRPPYERNAQGGRPTGRGRGRELAEAPCRGARAAMMHRPAGRRRRRGAARCARMAVAALLVTDAAAQSADARPKDVPMARNWPPRTGGKDACSACACVYDEARARAAHLVRMRTPPSWMTLGLDERMELVRDAWWMACEDIKGGRGAACAHVPPDDAHAVCDAVARYAPAMDDAAATLAAHAEPLSPEAGRSGRAMCAEILGVGACAGERGDL